LFIKSQWSLSAPYGLKNAVVALFVRRKSSAYRARKTCERMLRHRAVYGDNCGVVWVLRITWCSQKPAHPKEDYREFAWINQRRTNWKIHRSS